MTLLLQVRLIAWRRFVFTERCCHVQAAGKPMNVMDDRLAAKLKHSKSTIEHARSLYRPDELLLCFNGGKDCTVLLDILAKQWNFLEPLRGICVKSHDPFEEVEQFIESCAERYNIKLHRYNGVLKLAIEQALAEQPEVRAVFMGCRRTDPSCEELLEMSACDNNWPALMRIFPLLEWSYHDIWNYIRSHKLPYCSLYDQGYTSLGEKTDTRINPSLLVYDEQLGKLIYRPAYELQDDKLERANRDDAVMLKSVLLKRQCQPQKNS